MWFFFVPLPSSCCCSWPLSHDVGWEVRAPISNSQNYAVDRFAELCTSSFYWPQKLSVINSPNSYSSNSSLAAAVLLWPVPNLLAYIFAYCLKSAYFALLARTCAYELIVFWISAADVSITKTVASSIFWYASVARVYSEINKNEH